MQEYTRSENGENGEKFFEGQEIPWEDGKWSYQHTSIKILGIISMLCIEKGRGFSSSMFPGGKAFFCRVNNIPFRNQDHSTDFITRYCVIGNHAGPKHQFIDWCLDPPGNDGDGWDESDIFSLTPEEAVRNKILDIENMAKLETLCKYCPSRVACRERLESFAPITKALALKSTKTELMNVRLEKTRLQF